MSQNDTRTVPLFSAHSDKSDGKLRVYGAIEQHEFNTHTLLVYTLDETLKRKKGRPEPAAFKRVIVMGWLMGPPRPQAGRLPPLVDIGLISTEDYQEVTQLMSVIHPNREVTIWK